MISLPDEPKQRWKLTLEYNGQPFCGWQLQQQSQEARTPSVQGVVERAITKFCGEGPRLTVAGRTDAGVHALAQVAHVDLRRTTSADEIQGALNYHLRRHPVAILRVEAVPGADTPGADAPADTPGAFDARHSALARHYIYKIISRRAPLTFQHGLAWQTAAPLDIMAMQQAAGRLLGRHDFSTFRAADCQASGPVRTLSYFDFSETQTGHGTLIEARVGARSFLHHQVRNMIGTLALVGRGAWSQQDFAAAFAAADRRAGGPTAPAAGLYLAKVDY